SVTNPAVPGVTGRCGWVVVRMVVARLFGALLRAVRLARPGPVGGGGRGRRTVHLVALVEPAAEPGGVRVDAVQGLELLAALRVDVVEVGAEGRIERGGDVAAVAPRCFGDL